MLYGVEYKLPAFGFTPGEFSLALFKLELLLIVYYLVQRIQNQAVIFDVHDGSAILRHPCFNASWPTVLYVHGWNESPGEESAQHVVSAYLERGGYNVIVLNWEYMAGNMYHKAMLSISHLGAHVANGLLSMISEGLPLDTFHVVGHSLGAQLSGHVGRNIIRKSHGKVKLTRWNIIHI